MVLAFWRHVSSEMCTLFHTDAVFWGLYEETVVQGAHITMHPSHTQRLFFAALLQLEIGGIECPLKAVRLSKVWYIQ